MQTFLRKNKTYVLIIAITILTVAAWDVYHIRTSSPSELREINDEIADLTEEIESLRGENIMAGDPKLRDLEARLKSVSEKLESYRLMMPMQMKGGISE